MMKKYFILFVLVLLPLLVMGQAAGGQITRQVKKQETATTPPKKQTMPAKKKDTTPPKRQRITPTKKMENSLSPVLQNLINNMVRVEGGTFTMGATSEQGSEAESDEKPAHQVTLSSFSIGKYEVTQEEWEAVMGSNPSKFRGAKRPVERVSWNDCQEFIRKLNVLTGKLFRLPMEAEWEFAARGGNHSQGFKYAGSNSINSVSWNYENSHNKGSNSPDYGTHPVGQKQSNELGLYDMAGNVCEWCQDWYGNYSSNSQTNPTGPSSASLRMARGGSWGFLIESCRVSDRDFYAPDCRDYRRGLRLAL